MNDFFAIRQDLALDDFNIDLGLSSGGLGMNTDFDFIDEYSEAVFK